MAKANITTQNGTTIVIEGTAEEVAVLIERFNDLGGAPIAGVHGKRATPSKRQGTAKARTTAGPKALITEMAENDFFKAPKGLTEIKDELEVGGHHYEITSLSTVVLRLVKARVLRRIKKDGAWKYAKA